MKTWGCLVIAVQLILAAAGVSLAAAPLSLANLETLLKSKVSSKRIAHLVSERKVAFRLTPPAARRLHGMGATESLIAAIERNPVTSVAVESDPSGAELFLDGKYQGTTPALLEKVDPGRHELQVGRVEGYREHSEQILLEAGAPWKTRIILKRRDPPAVSQGAPPEVVTARKEGTKTVPDEAAPSQTPPLPPASSRKHPPPAQAADRLLVPVRVQTEPVADIYLDGKHIAASPADFLVTVGQHQLRLVPTLSAKYETVEKEISVKTNALNVFFLRLNSKR